MIRMADVKTISSEDKWNLNAIYNKVIHECNERNFGQALKLSQEGLALASKTNNKEWVQKFDMLYTQTILEYNIQRKLDNAANEVKNSVGNKKKYKKPSSSITTLDKWQKPYLNNEQHNQKFDDFTLDKIIAKIDTKVSSLKDKKFSSNYRNNLKEKLHNSLKFNEDLVEAHPKVSSLEKGETPDIDHNRIDVKIRENQEIDEVDLNKEENSIKLIENLKEAEFKADNETVPNLKIVNDFLDDEPTDFLSSSQNYNKNLANKLNDEIQCEILEKNRINDIRKNIEQVLKTSEYFVIPRSYFSLNDKIYNYIDSLGIKIISIKKDLDVIIITLIKICNLKGTVIVSDDKLKYQSLSQSPHLELNEQTQSLLVRPINENLLQARSLIHQDLAQEGRLFEFFKKYLKVHISLEKSKNNNKISFRSGMLQYQIFIEPILLCQSDPTSIEKSVVYPYQIKSNIHFINSKDISKLTEFLEKKYELIKTYSQQNNLVEKYFKEKLRFINNLRLYSLPFVVFGFIFLLLFILQLYLLVNSFIGLAFAAICLYPIVLLFLYLRFYKIKNSISKESSIHTHHGNVTMDETDLLMISKELSTLDMDQFIYELYGKSADFNFISKLEEQKIQQGISNHKHDKKLNEFNNDQLESSLQTVKYASSKHTKDKLTSKYGSFLED